LFSRDWDQGRVTDAELEGNCLRFCGKINRTRLRSAARNIPFKGFVRLWQLLDAQF
jgi:hypothetical protein